MQLCRDATYTDLGRRGMHSHKPLIRHSYLSPSHAHTTNSYTVRLDKPCFCWRHITHRGLFKLVKGGE